MTKRKDLRRRRAKAHSEEQSRRARQRNGFDNDQTPETQPVASQDGLLGRLAGLLHGGDSQQSIVSEESAELATTREELAEVDEALDALDISTADPDEFSRLRGQRRSLLEKIDALTGART